MQITFNANSAKDLHDKIVSFCKEFGISNEASKQQILPLAGAANTSGGEVNGDFAAAAPAAVHPSTVSKEKGKPGRKPKEAAATSFTDEEPEAAPVVETPVAETPPAAKPAAAHTITKQQVTDALTALNGKKGLAACRTLLLEFGTDRLSSVAAERYPDFIAKCSQAMA